MELRKLRNEAAPVGTGESIPVRHHAAKWAWAIAAILLCSLAIAGVTYWRSQSQTASTQGITATPFATRIDLSQAGTTRGGETSTVSPVVLPRRVIAAHILLPYFSPGGNYVISVTTDRNGGPPRAEGRAVAGAQGVNAELEVTLDLRSLPGGMYYLATTHEKDQASYYYPLTVR